jgi:AcrR family transcriptional regulator
MPQGQDPADRWLTARGAVTRARIVAVAAGLFARDGVAATRVQDVRRAADVSGSQITHYFGGKRGLVKAVLRWEADASVKSLARPASAGPRTLSDLRAWAEGVTVVNHPAWCFCALAGELAQSDSETLGSLAEGLGAWAAMLGEAIEDMRNHGVLRPDAKPEELAHTLLATLLGGMLAARVARRAEPQAAALEGMLGYLASFTATAVPSRCESRAATGHCQPLAGTDGNAR